MQQHKNGDAPHQDAATAVSHFHTHSVPLDMEDIRRDWDKPISEAGLAAKTSFFRYFHIPHFAISIKITTFVRFF